MPLSLLSLMPSRHAFKCLYPHLIQCLHAPVCSLSLCQPPDSSVTNIIATEPVPAPCATCTPATPPASYGGLLTRADTRPRACGRGGPVNRIAQGGEGGCITARGCRPPRSGGGQSQGLSAYNWQTRMRGNAVSKGALPDTETKGSWKA